MVFRLAFLRKRHTLQDYGMAEPIRIVFLMQDLCYGGTQRQTLELARRLDRGRFRPILWTCTGETSLDHQAREYDIPVVHLGTGRSPNPLCLLPMWGRLMGSRPEVLVLCTALPNVWGRILGRLSLLPVIIATCRGGGALVNQHETLLWRLAHHTICNSLQLYNKLLDIGLPPGRLTYIPNGVDTDYYQPSTLPEREQRILTVGRFVADKDQMTLLRAFALVLEKFPNASLHVVGEGPQERALRRLMDNREYAGRAFLLPASDDVRQHYANARIFALSSIREGQPNVILEAMASGLPVVSTDVGGIPTMVRHGQSGLLSPAGNHVELANNLCRLLDDDALCQRMGEVGRQLATDNFSFERMVDGHQQLFERLWSLHGKG